MYQGPACFRWNGERVDLAWMQRHYNVHLVPAPPGPAFRVATLIEEFDIDLNVSGGPAIRAILPDNVRVYPSPFTQRMDQQNWSYAPFGDGREIAQGGPLGVMVDGMPSDYVDRLGIAVGQDGGQGSSFYPPPNIQGNYGHINVSFVWVDESPGTPGGTVGIDALARAVAPLVADILAERLRRA